MSDLQIVEPIKVIPSSEIGFLDRDALMNKGEFSTCQLAVDIVSAKRMLMEKCYSNVDNFAAISVATKIKQAVLKRLWDLNDFYLPIQEVRKIEKQFGPMSKDFDLDYFACWLTTSHFRISKKRYKYLDFTGLFYTSQHTGLGKLIRLTQFNARIADSEVCDKGFLSIHVFERVLFESNYESLKIMEKLR
ncbi:MAG: hypothetical protein Q4E62_08180, partial [Sutterellaceae bacterium]|nr:hypothetical protein [Sutterellaceae bacterium]